MLSSRGSLWWVQSLVKNSKRLFYWNTATFEWKVDSRKSEVKSSQWLTLPAAGATYHFRALDLKTTTLIYSENDFKCFWRNIALTQYWYSTYFDCLQQGPHTLSEHLIIKIIFVEMFPTLLTFFCTHGIFVDESIFQNTLPYSHLLSCFTLNTLCLNSNIKQLHFDKRMCFYRVCN